MFDDRHLWAALKPGDELTIIKTHYTPGRPDYTYPARVIQSDKPDWFAFEAEWALEDMNVDGILYETGGRIIEYFSPEQFFNIFHVYRRDGESAGLYANVTQLPMLSVIDENNLYLTWIDCWIDVVKLPHGEMRVLDEDEFEASGIAQHNPLLAQQIRDAGEAVFRLLESDTWTP